MADKKYAPVGSLAYKVWWLQQRRKDRKKDDEA